MSAVSLEQRRAAHAWKWTDPERCREKYGEFVNLAASAPALVMSNGLMQTLAFYKDKAKGTGSPHECLLEGILAWIGREVLSIGDPVFDRVMPALHGDGRDAAEHSDRYMRATEETLEILTWIRQFAKARKKDR